MNDNDTTGTTGSDRGSVLNIIPDGYFTRAQVAERIGKSYDTIARWHRSGDFTAEHFVMAGKSKIWLYSNEDIELMIEFAGKQKPGPKTDQED